MKARGRPIYELHRTSMEALGYTIAAIKEWREQEHNAGRPSGLEDFYRAHGICFTCRASGITVSPVGWDGDTPLHEQCPICGGTGKPQPI